MRRNRFAPAVALVMAAVLWGLCFRLEPQPGEADLEALPLSKGAGPALAPGETAPGGMAFRNRGNEPCRVRVKICSTQVEGLAVLQAGDLVDGEFRPAGGKSSKEKEFWQARGEYLYYQNRDTGGLLLPGRETPAVYSAVRVNGKLGKKEVEALRLMGDQQLFVIAQAQPEGGEEWIPVPV